MMTRTIATAASILIGAASVSLAQNAETNVIFRSGAPSAGIATYQFISSEMTIDGKVVTGHPYSAEAVTETTQVLADGNRIARKTSASLYRDSEGRTRREQTLPSIGPWSTAGAAVRTVFINDPVAGTAYSLNENDKTAHKLPGGLGAQGIAMAASKIAAEGAFTAARAGGTATHREMTYVQRTEKAGAAPKEHTGKTEDLGTQTIEGVAAKGTRSTVTIPAGEIGNDRAIEIVTERWYSPELGLVVMTKHSDPRMGETTYKLTNLQSSEPSKALFQVPPDYKMVEGGEMIIHKGVEHHN